MAMTKLRLFSEGEVIAGTSYRVRKLIGRGGMGSVYEVEHIELGRVFVLKALHGHLSTREDLVGRMRNEWRALAKLNHPNIVQVTDAGTMEEGLPYFIMEHLQGQALSDLLKVEGRLGLRTSCSILGDVLNGLSAAHATGAIHRDIKPPNIFITKEGRAKLLDFGIAKLRDRAAKVVTAGGISIGTPRYMAPEQAEGGKVDGRADIYAAALVLYECLLGQGPFAHVRDPNSLVMAHLTEEPVRADIVDSMVPAEMGDLLHRWLSKAPNSRPPTAEQAARELSALAQALPEVRAVDQTGESTVGASYNAPTLGFPASVPGSTRGGPAKSSASANPVQPDPVPKTDDEGSRTQTIDPWSPPSDSSKRARAPVEPSHQPEPSSASDDSDLPLADDSALPVAGDMPQQVRASAAGVPIVGPLLAAATVSLLVAWGVMRWGGPVSESPPDDRSPAAEQEPRRSTQDLEPGAPSDETERKSVFIGRSIPVNSQVSAIQGEKIEKKGNTPSPVRPPQVPVPRKPQVEEPEDWDKPPPETMDPVPPARDSEPAAPPRDSAELPGSGLW